MAPFYVMRVLSAAARRAEAGLPVFDLTAGQPSSPAPKPVLEAAHRALDGHILGYTEATGILPLREAIARHYADWYGLDIEPRQVVVTTGSSGGFLLSFLAAFDTGDRVGLVRPGYPAYRNILQALGCEVVDVPCGPESRYRPTVSMIDGLNLKGMILASPANPTGTMVGETELGGMTKYFADRGIRLISDEIYHGIAYGQRAQTAWATDRSGILVSSFSKYFAMTGWRIGWLVLPEDLLDRVDALAGNLAICPPAISQYAAVQAFSAYDECDALVRGYAANRTVLLDGLRALGIDRVAPADGAFYVYADIGHLTDDSQAWAARLLDTAGVALAPGIDFDVVDGHRFVRLSFAGRTENIASGIDALARFLARD